MKVKIDTKEKFDVLTLQEPVLYANMTEELNHLLLSFLKRDKKNIVLKMAEVKEIDVLAVKSLVNIRKKFYANNTSFVICEITPTVKEYLSKLNLFEIMNTTSTESEAGDIVEMEEIEREWM